MNRVVIIEDDSDLLSLLTYNLEKEGYEVHGMRTGDGAVEFCARVRPGLVLLDIMLPGAGGLDILKRIRKNDVLSRTPVIAVTARAAEADRVLGLELGASDYVTKPFFLRELLVRVKLQFRRDAGPPAVLEAGGVTLDRAGCTVRVDGNPLSLTATEFRLLEFLMNRPGIVFSREQLLDGIWGRSHAITDRAVDVYILRLRHKLRVDVIHSVRGFGYVFRTAEPAAMAAG